MVLTSSLRAVFLVPIVFLLIIAGFVGFFRVTAYVHDKSTIPEVNKALGWIEDFYSGQGRYPSNEEFERQFPDIRVKARSSGNDAYDYDSGYNAYDSWAGQQRYLLRYNLRRESPDAPGHAMPGVFGYTGEYQATPCPRWGTITRGDTSPTTQVSIEYPRGVIRAGFYQGEIYFIHYDGNDFGRQKIVLLQNLEKPRLFSTAEIVTAADHILVTDGDSIYAYDWNGSEMKLLNRQKVGTVPNGCVTNTHY